MLKKIINALFPIRHSVKVGEMCYYVAKGRFKESLQSDGGSANLFVSHGIWERWLDNGNKTVRNRNDEALVEQIFPYTDEGFNEAVKYLESLKTRTCSPTSS